MLSRRRVDSEDAISTRGQDALRLPWLGRVGVGTRSRKIRRTVFKASPSKVKPRQQGRITIRNTVSPVSDAPYEVVRVTFREKCVASVQEAGSRGRGLSELFVRDDKHEIFSLASPHGEIEVTDFSSVFLVQTGVRDANDVL